MFFRRDLLPTWRPATVPDFPGWRAMLGPGVVWMALAQGSGELIWWPYIIAKYGLTFLFLLLPASLLQWPITYEIGRYTTLTGESIWQGFIRLHPWFAFPLWILMLASFLWFGAFASAGGTALASLTDFPAGWATREQSLFWAYVTIAVFLVALIVSPILYGFIEKFMWAVALTTLVGLLAACTHPAVVAKVPSFLAGLVAPPPLGRPWEPRDASPLLTAITFAGVGGFWTLFYSYWLREKGVGLATYADRMTGLLGKPETVPHAGYVPEDEPAAAARLALWHRFLRVDSGIGIVGNILTTLMTCLLAYAVLTPAGMLPEGWSIAAAQGEFFALRWGAAGKALFMVVAAAFLSDTWLSTADAVSRVNTDVVYHFFPASQRRSVRWWYYLFLAIVTVVTCTTMPLAQPGELLVISAITGFCGTVVFSVGLLALNHVYMPPRLPAFARPRLGSRIALAVSCIAYLGLASAYLWVQFR